MLFSRLYYGHLVLQQGSLTDAVLALERSGVSAASRCVCG